MKEFEINAEKKQNNSGLKATIVILLLLLLGSLGYMYKMSNDSKVTENTLISEKDSVLKDLKVASDSLDVAIASNTTLSSELIAERDKIQQLIADVEKAKGDAASMSKYKVEASNLRNRVATLMKEVTALKQENEKLTVQRDSTVTELGKAKVYNDTLVSQKENLAKIVEKGSKLTVLNLQTTALKQRSSGKQIATEKASKSDILKISFTIAENQIAKSGDKTYYVQVIDSKNNVLGDKKTEDFDDKTLSYSFATSVKYENKTVQVSKDLPVTKIEAGTYFVNVFDKAELVSKTSFVLK